MSDKIDDKDDSKKDDVKLDNTDKVLNEMIDKFNAEEESKKPFSREFDDSEAIEEILKIRDVDEKSDPTLKEINKLRKKLHFLLKERELYRDKLLSRLEDLFIEEGFQYDKIYKINKKDGKYTVSEVVISKIDIEVHRRRMANLLKGSEDMTPEEINSKIFEIVQDVQESASDFVTEINNLKDDEDNLYLK